jgi:hypothetical protein
MMSVYNCKLKKDLKTKIGQRAEHLIQETSMFGPELVANGKFAVVGPAPTVRKWYATVTVKDGVIVAVE